MGKVNVKLTYVQNFTSSAVNRLVDWINLTNKRFSQRNALSFDTFIFGISFNGEPQKYLVF